MWQGAGRGSGLLGPGRRLDRLRTIVSRRGAEPYNLLVATVAMCGGRANTAEWVPAVIAASLIVAGKTLAEFDVDVAKDAEEMAAGLGEREDAPQEATR